MRQVEIYWDDLSDKGKQKIFEALGDNGNYDVFPLAILDFEEDVNENTG